MRYFFFTIAFQLLFTLYFCISYAQINTLPQKNIKERINKKISKNREQNKKKLSLTYKQLPFKFQKNSEQETNILLKKGEIRESMRIALLFSCKPYCKKVGEIFVGNGKTGLTYSIQWGSNNSKAIQKRYLKYIGRSSLLFLALQSSNSGYTKKQDSQLTALSRHKEQSLYKTIDNEILLIYQPGYWGLEGDFDLGLASRSLSTSSDIQSESSSSYHPDIQIRGRGILPWDFSLLKKTIKTVGEVTFSQGFSEISSNNDTRAITTSNLSFGISFLSHWGEHLSFGPSFMYRDSSFSFADSDSLGFSSQTTNVFAGLDVKYRWFSLSLQTSLQSAITDELNLRGQAENQSNILIKSNVCPFSYTIFNFYIFPCFWTEIETNKEVAPGTSLLPSLERSSELSYTHTKFGLRLTVRQLLNFNKKSSSNKGLK